MRALSIRQPWAWLIIRPDLVGAELRNSAVLAGQVKNIENRSWSTDFRGEILIHAAKGMTRAEYDNCRFYALDRGVVVPPMKDLQRGGIIGRAEVVDCVHEGVLTAYTARWFMGPYGLRLVNPQPTEFVPLKGMLGFFRVSDDFAPVPKA